MKVLFIHPVGQFGGASKSLGEMYSQLPENEVDGSVYLPRGASAQYFRGIGLKVYDCYGVSQFNHTYHGKYAGLRWIILLRELLYYPLNVFHIYKMVKRLKPDVVHLNEITLAHIIPIIKFVSNAKVLVTVRSLGIDDSSLRSRFLRYLVNKADCIVSIDETVSTSIGHLTDSLVIHNGLKCCNYDRASNIKNEPKLRIGYVGNILRSKGIFELLYALHNLKKMGVNDVELHVYGDETRQVRSFFRKAILKVLRVDNNLKDQVLKLVDELSLDDFVKFHGFVKDTNEIYSKIDVLCFVSSLNAPGRPVFEAACFGVPSIVSVDNPTDDTIKHMETGYCIKNNSVDEIVKAITFFNNNRDLIDDYAKSAFNLYSKFYVQENNSLEYLSLYKRLLSVG